MDLKPQLEVSDREEMERILASINIGRLVTSGADGYPYITAVNFVFFEGFVYLNFRAASGQTRFVRRFRGDSGHGI